MKRQPGYFIIYHGRDALLQKMVLDHNQKMEGLQIAATQEDKCRHRLTSVQSPVDQQLRHPAPVWWILWQAFYKIGTFYGTTILNMNKKHVCTFYIQVESNLIGM